MGDVFTFEYSYNHGLLQILLQLSLISIQYSLTAINNLLSILLSRPGMSLPLPASFWPRAFIGVA